MIRTTRDRTARTGRRHRRRALLLGCLGTAAALAAGAVVVHVLPAGADGADGAVAVRVAAASGTARSATDGGTPAGATPSAAAASGPSGPGTTATAVTVTPAAGTPTATAAASAGCARPAGATPRTRVTTVQLGSRVTGYGDESDTAALPAAIAPTPDGRSWLAWLGTDGRVHLGRLGCDDRLVGTPTSFAGVDLQDVQADARGGVLLLTRAGSCHTGPLCGGSSSPCRTMWMVRFDTAGELVWQRQVTNLTSTRGGYDDGARFVWWYQHHGRLASDGTNYAAYFGVAITVKNGSCVDIHEGDRMQVVGPTGALLAGHGSFPVGCSHAWTSRITYDKNAKRFVMVCATDNGCRIAQPAPYRTVAAGTCDGTLFGGDLVAARAGGTWTAWSQGGVVRLARFTTGAANRTVTTSARSAHPHLVRYGGRMLLAWESGSSTLAQVLDAGTGAAVGARFRLAARDHAYLAWKAYPDGSAAVPAAGPSGTSLRVARVLPLA